MIKLNCYLYKIIFIFLVKIFQKKKKKYKIYKNFIKKKKN